jgi:hypothetical protein
MSEKTRMTIRLSQEALALMLSQGYATRRTLGDFLSQLMFDYHQRQSPPGGLTPSPAEWRQFVDETEQLLSAATDQPE